jgi:hypothetical protein
LFDEGLALMKDDQDDEAIVMFKKHLETCNLDHEHVYQGTCLYNLGMLMLHAHKYTEAQAHSMRSLEIDSEAL